MGDDEKDDLDPFGDWRRDAASTLPAIVEKQPYTAWDNPTDRRPERIHVCPGGDAAYEWMPYAGLERIVHDRQGTIVGLIWAFAVVIIRGQRLHQLNHHLAHSAIQEVRALDPDLFLEPTELAAPIIESIEIRTESRAARLNAEIKELQEIERRH